MILERPEKPFPRLAELRQGLDGHNIANGITAFLFATTGALVILISVALGAGEHAANGLEGDNLSDWIASWIFGSYAFGGLLSIVFSMVYRQTLGIAWTMPGAVLLASSLDHLHIDEIIGAYIGTAALLTVLGLTGWVRRIMDAIPLPVVMGMVAGVFLPFMIRMVEAFEDAWVISVATLAAFIVLSLVPMMARYVPPILGALLVGIVATVATGGFQLDQPIQWSLAEPVLYTPVFTWQASVELIVPLAVTVVGIQNAQGFAILRDNGFPPPSNALTVICGGGSFLMGAVGSVPTCVTGPVNGILNASGVRERRWVGGVVFGALMLLFGLFSPITTSIALALPLAFIGLLGGLALLPVLRGAFATAFGGRYGLGALIAFVVTVSGITIFNIGAAFWGLVAGMLTSLILEWADFKGDRAAATADQEEQS